MALAPTTHICRRTFQWPKELPKQVSISFLCGFKQGEREPGCGHSVYLWMLSLSKLKKKKKNHPQPTCSPRTTAFRKGETNFSPPWDPLSPVPRHWVVWVIYKTSLRNSVRSWEKKWDHTPKPPRSAFKACSRGRGLEWPQNYTVFSVSPPALKHSDSNAKCSPQDYLISKKSHLLSV